MNGIANHANLVREDFAILREHVPSRFRALMDQLADEHVALIRLARGQDGDPHEEEEQT